MNNDLISREALRKAFHERMYYFNKSSWDEANTLIDKAPAVEPVKQCKFCKHCGDVDYCSDCHSDYSLFEYSE